LKGKLTVLLIVAFVDMLGLIIVYPLLITGTVLVTGNHWWFDAFLGALVAGVSALAASGALARARPDAWAFRSGLREAPV